MTKEQLESNEKLFAEMEKAARAATQGQWRWAHCYERGNGVKNWAIETPETAAAGKIVSTLLMLDHTRKEYFYKPVQEDPNLRHIEVNCPDNVLILLDALNDVRRENGRLRNRLENAEDAVKNLVEKVEQLENLQVYEGLDAEILQTSD